MWNLPTRLAVWLPIQLGRRPDTVISLLALPSKASKGAVARWRTSTQVRSTFQQLPAVRHPRMVCPVCITTAIVANAPALAGLGLGGVAAVKMCINRNRAPTQSQPTQEQARTKQVPRPLVDPIKVNRYDEEEW
ncbi:hypothetical protein PLESTF_000426100 [Pleodorina starrii]|nr:hypothetical protein PLESTF_000426100 [Pleodorina starrii]